MIKNAFELADRRFLNTDRAGIQITHLGNELVHQCLRDVKQAFRSLDYSDDYQSQLGFMLFRIRCSLLFGLAPYSHVELRLLEQGQELAAMAESLPGSRNTIARLNKQLEKLLDTPNPKLEWVMHQEWEKDSSVIFAPMAMGKSFGSHLVAEQENHHFRIIQSMGELNSGKYSTLVLPGTMRYLSYALSMKLLHRGEFANIHVLLYEGESLDLKKRIELPSSPLFPDLASRGVLKVKSSKKEFSGYDERLPTTVLDLHEKGTQAKGSDKRFLLFENGAGRYVIENECVQVWRMGSLDGLINVYPIQLLEGDFLVLEKGQRHDLFHDQEDVLNFRKELDTTEVWRVPLKALLLTHTTREVATLMMEVGNSHDSSSSGSVVPTGPATAVRNLQASISNWADGQVFGPGNIAHMRALVRVLMKTGHLKVKGSFDAAVEEWFETLEAIRFGRQAAGMSLSSRRDQLVKECLEKQTELEDGKHLVLSNGMVISLHKLAIVGEPVQMTSMAKATQGTLPWLE